MELAVRRRTTFRAVAVPTEHGGWGLTLEPALLGLLVAWSASGVALGAAALLAFVARTPVKCALVDRWRHRRLPRTVLAEKVAAVEGALLVGLVTLAALMSRGAFWVPVAIAFPLVVVELWFDMRSRSRRLLPELTGAIGVGSVAAAIVLADDGQAELAAALWCIVAARAVGSIPFVRLQLQRFKGQAYRRFASDAAQVAAATLGAAALVLDSRLLAGFTVITVIGAFHVWAARRRPSVAAVLGAQQVVLGLTVVIVTALGVMTP